MNQSVTLLREVEPPSAPQPSYSVTPVTPMAMISQAVANGASMEMIEKLMALHERIEAGQARKAFDAALAAAKAEIPVITKNRQVGYETKSGGKTSYQHEDLGEIARTVDPILAKHGLSYRFRTLSELNQPVSVTCIVAHRDGHSETNTLTAGRDDSGQKNLIQQIGSTITYLQRYTLKAALGLAASQDNDGRSAQDQDDEQFITNDQVMELREYLESVGIAESRFRELIKVSDLSAIYATKFQAAKDLIRQKANRRG